MIYIYKKFILISSGIFLLLFLGLELKAQTIESEPNGTFQTADSLGLSNLTVTVQGAVSQLGDKDFYKIDVPQAGVLDIGIIDVGGNVDIEVFVYDAGQSQVHYEGNNHTNGTPLYTRKLVCGMGTYYFRIADWGNNESSTQLYSFTIALDTTDVYECNNTLSTAWPLPINTTIQAAINSTGDHDYYQFNVPRAGVFDLGLVNVGASINAQLLIYDTGQSLINYSGVGANGAPQYTRELVCGAGTYYIRVFDYGDNASDPQLYSLTTVFDTTDVYECNNTISTATPLPINTTIQAAINSTGDHDYYQVNVPRDGVLDLGLVNVGASINAQLLIYDTGQTLIHYSGVGANGVAQYTRKLVCGAGTYYIRVFDYGDNDSDPQLYSLTIGFDTTDVHECNNDFNSAAAITICDTIEGSIGVNGDEDFFTFNGTANQQVDFTLTNVASNISPTINFYDSFQIQIATFSGNNGQPMQNAVILPHTGQYYVKIRDDNNNDSNPQLYTLILDDGCNTVAVTDQILAKIQLFPNPAQDFITLKLGHHPLSASSVKVFTMAGTQVLAMPLTQSEILIETEALPGGIYIFEILLEGQRYARKVLIK